MLAILVLGCGRRSSETESTRNTNLVVEATDASLRSSSPRKYLEAVFARYRDSSSYRDRGVVRLDYQVGNRRESTTAPMQVWFDRDRLYFEAYDVRLWSDGDFVTAWINDADSKDFDSQVLRVPAISGRPTIKMLLSDPILADRISAGLAGPPPQLDWLFAGRPMAELFAAEHRFEFGDALAIGGRLCRGIRVHAGSELYQFWVDETLGVIRLVELPAIMAPAAPGKPLQSMSLSLELVDPVFDQARVGPDIAPLPVRPEYVRRFVPLPPEEPAAILGSRSPSFRMVDEQRNLTVTNRSSDLDCTILVHFADAPQALESIRAIDQWSASMNEGLKRRLRIAVLVDRQLAGRVPDDLSLAVLMDDDRLAQSLGLPAGGLLILDGGGRVAWIQPHLPPAVPQALATLGAIVGDILSGVDVPARIRAQWSDQVAEYRRSLDRESVRRK
jgi:hypothetical protein